MFKRKKTFIIQLILTLFLCMMLVFSGCLNQPVKEEETMLPSLQAQDLLKIQEQTLSWFNQHLNESTGLLSDTLESLTIADYIDTVQVLFEYSSENATYALLLDRSIDNLIDKYALQKNYATLQTDAQLLTLLCILPSSYNDNGLQDQLAMSILSNQQQNNTFNTTPVLSQDAALALNALLLFAKETTNETIKTRINDTVKIYQQIISEYLEKIDSSDPDHQEYHVHSFSIPFNTGLSWNHSDIEWYELISDMNNKLSDFQERYQNYTLGQYTSFVNKDPFLYQLNALESMSISYNLSKTLDQKNDESIFRQSLILGLIYLKNTILGNQSQSFTTEQNLSLILLLKQALSELPQTNWTYLWDSSNQQLIEGRSLETSPTVWTALTIGVMGSICLLALVFIIVQLYYKNKRN